MIPRRKPTHPGEIIRYDYLEPLNISVKALSECLRISRKHMSDIVNEHKPVSPAIALKLARAFNTTPELWLNLQRNYDLWHAAKSLKGLKSIKPLYSPGKENRIGN